MTTEQNYLTCISCFVKILFEETDVIGCDFCDSVLCDECQQKQKIYYYRCKKSELQYCVNNNYSCLQLATVDS